MATTEAAASTKATASATSKIQNYALLGKTYKKASSILNYVTKTTSKEDVESANIEKSVADAEPAQNTTQETCSSQTQHATTYPKFFRKTRNI